MKALKMGRELARRKRQYPEPWHLGEEMAEDRFELLPGEDRMWSAAMVDGYLGEVGQDAVKLAAAMASREGLALDTGALSTIGIACGFTLELPLREYINRGGAAGDMKAIADSRDDYDRGREMAEKGFFPEPAARVPGSWGATASRTRWRRRAA